MTRLTRDCSNQHNNTDLHQRRQLSHRNLLGAFHRHRHLLLVLPVQEGKHLPDNGVQSLAYLRLLVHLHVQAVGHLVVLHTTQFSQFRSKIDIGFTHHNVVPLHFSFFLGKFLAFQLQAEKRQINFCCPIADINVWQSI